MLTSARIRASHRLMRCASCGQIVAVVAWRREGPARITGEMLRSDAVPSVHGFVLGAQYCPGAACLGRQPLSHIRVEMRPTYKRHKRTCFAARSRRVSITGFRRARKGVPSVPRALALRCVRLYLHKRAPHSDSPAPLGGSHPMAAMAAQLECGWLAGCQKIHGERPASSAACLLPKRRLPR